MHFHFVCKVRLSNPKNLRLTTSSTIPSKQHHIKAYMKGILIKKFKPDQRADAGQGNLYQCFPVNKTKKSEAKQ